MLGYVQALIPVPEGWMSGKQSVWGPSFHGAGEDRIQRWDLRLSESSHMSFAMAVGIRKPRPPGRSQIQVAGLGEGSGVLSVQINRGPVPPNTRLDREEDKDLSGP